MTRIKILLFLLFVGIINAQNPVLVSDIRPGAAGSVEDWGTSSVQLGEKIFFIANNGTIKSGLYVMENNDVKLLKNLCIDCQLSSEMALFDGKVYFTASENNKLSLWHTDGTELNTKFVTDINHFKIDNFFVADEYLYFTSNDNLYVINDMLGVKIISGINAEFSTNGLDNLDYNKVCKYENGIAHLTLENDSILLYKITDTHTLLGKYKIDNRFIDFHGLNVVSNGLVYVYDNEMYNWRKSSGDIVKNSFSVGNKISRIIPFKLNEPLVFVSSNGYYLLKGTATVTLTKFSSRWDNLSQNDEIPRTVYNEQMVFFADDFNSFNDYIISTDGTTTNTKEFVAESSYPSNFYNINQNCFFATGIKNGFEPILYNYDFDSKNLTEIKKFSQSSLQSNTIMILGVVGKRIFYLGNLDASVGRELYYIETDINTSTDDVNAIPSDSYFNINKSGENLIVTNDQKSDERIHVSIHGMDGKLYQKFDSQTNLSFPIRANSNVYVVMISNESGQKVVSKIFIEQE